jgi:hypothetical protein
MMNGFVTLQSFKRSIGSLSNYDPETWNSPEMRDKSLRAGISVLANGFNSAAATAPPEALTIHIASSKKVDFLIHYHPMEPL